MYNTPPPQAVGEIYFPTTSTFLVLMLVGVKVDMLRHPFHSLASSHKWIHLGCIAICLAGGPSLNHFLRKISSFAKLLSRVLVTDLKRILNFQLIIECWLNWWHPGLLIPTAPFYGLATYIYDAKRATCTFDFYPSYHDERSKFFFVTWFAKLLLYF